MALFCPVVSMKSHANSPSVARLLGPNPDAKLIDELSNELQATAKTPPTFLAHAKDDTLVPPENSIQYHEALKKAGVTTTLKIYRQGGHGVTEKPNPWKADLGDWMSESGILPEGVARPAPGASKIYEPTTSYTVKDLAGWKVYVHNALLPGGEHAVAGAEAMKRLTDGMLRLKTRIPAGPMARLLEVKIWVELNSTKGPWGGTSAYQYHPGVHLVFPHKGRKSEEPIRISRRLEKGPCAEHSFGGREIGAGDHKFTQAVQPLSGPSSGQFDHIILRIHLIQQPVDVVRIDVTPTRQKLRIPLIAH